MWRALLLLSALVVEPAFASCKVCTHKKLYKGRCGALFKKKGSRWGTWGWGFEGSDGGICLEWESGNTCCASSFDDCCDSDDGAIAGLVIGIIAAIIIGICCCCFLCPGCYGFEKRNQKRAPPPENAPRTLESAEEPPVVQGNVVETAAAEKK